MFFGHLHHKILSVFVLGLCTPVSLRYKCFYFSILHPQVWIYCLATFWGQFHWSWKGWTASNLYFFVSLYTFIFSSPLFSSFLAWTAALSWHFSFSRRTVVFLPFLASPISLGAPLALFCEGTRNIIFTVFFFSPQLDLFTRRSLLCIIVVIICMVRIIWLSYGLVWYSFDCFLDVFEE